MKMQSSLMVDSNIKTQKSLTLNEILLYINKAYWKKKPYKFQNWANWLHRMSPYVGKIKPGMAYWLIKIASKEGQVILDPFCGIGTIPLEADLQGRCGIGVDLNPYAFSISRAKFDRAPIEEQLRWLDSVELDISKVSINDCSPFMKKFYHPNTLKEIIFLRDLMIEQERDFLLGCLLGIIHGHRPGHLSAVTSLVIPFEPKAKAEYKEVIPRLKDKVKRMYKDGFPLKTDGKVFLGDARKLPLEDASVDLVISSPPYFNTLDYVNDNKLRLEFLGYDEDKKEELKKGLIQGKDDYLGEMYKVGLELKRVIKKKGICIFVLGDLHTGKKVINTAEEVKKIYETIGFKTYGIIEDVMPKNKCVPSIYKRSKMDRILVMTNG